MTAKDSTASTKSVSVNERIKKRSENETSYLILDFISQYIRLPKILYTFCVFVLYSQLTISQLGNFCPSYRKNVIDLIRYYFLLDGIALGINTIMILSLVAIFLILNSYQHYYFRRNRKFKSFLMYPIRFFVEILPMVLSFPLCNRFSNILVSSINTGFNISNIMNLIVNAMAFLYFGMNFVNSLKMLSKSIFIENNLIFSFDSFPMISLVIYSPLIITSAAVFAVFEAWTSKMLLLIQIILLSIASYHCLYIPYVSRNSNIVITSIIFNFLLFDVFLLFNFINDIIIMSILPISILSSFLYYNKTVENIKKTLSYVMSESGEHKLNSKEYDYIKVFADNGFDKDIKKTIMYIQYGLKETCDLFIDFSLVKFVSQNNINTETISTCVQVVSFFPSEIRLLNSIISIMNQKRDLSESDYFLIFQISKIKILRQSSTSNSTVDSILKLKQSSKQCENTIKAFFSMDSISISELNDYYKSIGRMQSLWEEALKSYPNSVGHLEEYIRFLIECKTDFENSILNKHKVSLIESGKSYSVDHCFRSMVWCIPKYLKGSILDIKGSFVKKIDKKNGSQGKSSNNSSNDLIFSSIDLKMEEEIGKQMILQSKTRLSFQRATESQKAKNSILLSQVSIFLFIASIILFGFLYLYFNSFFELRYVSTERSTMASMARYHYNRATILSMIYWANNTNRINFESFSNEFLFNSGENHLVSQVYYDSIIDSVLSSRDYLVSFLGSLSELAQTGANVKGLAYIVLSDSVPRQLCAKGQLLTSSQSDLKTIIIHQLYHIQTLISGSDFDNWWLQNTEFCSIFSSHPFIGKAFLDLRQSLINDQVLSSKSYEDQLKLMGYILPISYGIISLFMVIFVSKNFYSEIETFISLLLSTQKEMLKTATLHIFKQNSDNNDNQNADYGIKKNSNNSCIVFSILFIIIFSIISGLLGIIIYNSITLNQQFQNMAFWTFMSSMRSPLIIDLLIALLQEIFITDINISHTNITNSTANMNIINSILLKLDSVKEELIMGNSDVVPLIGEDDSIDFFSIKEQCQSQVFNSTFHDYYKCSSINQLFGTFSDIIHDIVFKINDLNSSLNNHLCSHLLHLSLDHLIPLIQQMDTKLDSLMLSYVQNFKNSLLLYCVIGLFASVMSLVIIHQYIASLNSSFFTLIILLRRIPPLGIISNTKLMEYLLNQGNDKHENETSTEGSIVYSSNDGIICMNKAGIIEIVNPSVTSILGFTPEQLLGQGIRTILSPDDYVLINNQIGLISNNQSSSYEGNVTCFDDSEQKIPCSLTLNGIANDSVIDSFVIILRDERELFRQQKEAEEAKRKSEELLYQILPRDIVVKLNQGEKDITFVVQSASVMFIDIVKFSEYSATLSPQEILGNLSQIFSTFDECLAKYPLLTKIKLIGDVYMCASGLFSMNETDANHAEQIIKFGIEALQQLEELNLKLNANLSIRIGVNSGGPLIAGVLGTDKPVFDIIGDTINVASRLQSTDIAGKIQISQATFDLINGMDFYVEQRGEIFLKGKGKTQTYLVSPPQMIFQLASGQLSMDSSSHVP